MIHKGGLYAENACAPSLPNRAFLLGGKVSSEPLECPINPALSTPVLASLSPKSVATLLLVDYRRDRQAGQAEAH